MKDGIEYGYNEFGQLVSIDMEREYETESSGDESEKTMLQSLRAQLNGWIDNPDAYQVSDFTESSIGYQAVLETEVGDSILAAFDMAGNLSWAALYYKNHFEPITEQVACYQAALEEYLSRVTGKYTDYTIATEYKPVQDKTFAIYTIYFEGEDGSVWTDQIVVG